MIDTHCHILYGADDGAEDIFDSVEMLRIAEECGVTDIIATPHCYPGMFNNFNGKTLNARYDRFLEQIKESGRNVRVHRGMEVYADNDTVRRFDEGRLMTLADSRYLLIECAFNEHPRFMQQVLEKLLERGVHPIVAHPERYFFVRDRLEHAIEWVEMGCSLQLNAGSITGYFGRECRNTAHMLLSLGAAQLIASDAHGAISRTPDLQEAYEHVGVRFSFKVADSLFNDNPARILENRRLRFPNMEPEGALRRERFMSDEEYWGV